MGLQENQKILAREKLVKKKLIDVDMTQRELACKIGVHETFLTNMLKGRKVGEKYWLKIALVLGMSFEDIS